VRASWGAEFADYARHNVLATQRLLERYKGAAVERVVVASSSSVYGDAERMPTGEGDLPKPFSPYGVTKLAAEHLALLYARNFGMPAVALRYFTVYGPRQRPDMGFHRFLKALLGGSAIPVYGDGEQTRDFTYVADAVAANLAAAEKGVPGRAYNIGGGSRVSVNRVLEAIGKIAGKAPEVQHGARQPGDPRDTGADIARRGTSLVAGGLARGRTRTAVALQKERRDLVLRGSRTNGRRARARAASSRPSPRRPARLRGPVRASAPSARPLRRSSRLRRSAASRAVQLCAPSPARPASPPSTCSSTTARSTTRRAS
jgi:UDP-glucose 4-epimerase